MLIAVIAMGIVTLVCLAVIVGYLDEYAQRAVWKKIATERRALAERALQLDERAEALAEEARKLWEWEARLIAAAESGDCPACELGRRRGQGPAS